MLIQMEGEREKRNKKGEARMRKGKLEVKVKMKSVKKNNLMSKRVLEISLLLKKRANKKEKVIVRKRR